MFRLIGTENASAGLTVPDNALILTTMGLPVGKSRRDRKILSKGEIDENI
jgi:hypothetical protein